jgi:hypothetical protein
MDLGDVRWGGVNWIGLAQGRGRWRAPPSRHLIPLRAKYLPKHPVLKHPQSMVFVRYTLQIEKETVHMQGDTQSLAHYVIWTRSRSPLSPSLRSPRCARGNGFGPAVHCVPHVACELSLCSNTGCLVFCLRWPQRSSLHRSGSVVFEALCYNPEGRGFETQWGDFFLNLPNLSGRTRP